MGWPGHLSLNYRRAGDRSVVLDRHRGPLRVLQSLYPEGPAVCHSVLVHPPGGIVGGDTLDIDVTVGPQAHALVTTPGAGRFYRSAGEAASQSVQAHLADGARLEWLPLETIVHSGALAENRLRFALAPGSEMIGWDMVALGLPASGDPFVQGRFTQHLELPGHWLERGVIDAGDTRLLDSPLGWAGHRVMATLWFAAGQALPADQAGRLLDSARCLSAGHALAGTTGTTAVHGRCVVLRSLAGRVEPATQLLSQVWQAWRREAWGLAGTPPRIWGSHRAPDA